jgi:APA family basic amino acid/polyamine antiporter
MTDKDDGKMGIWMTTALVVGTIIGAAIFMLPVSLAPLGRNAVIGWLVSGFGMLCVAFALARLSQCGGDGIQANIERKFGRTVGFLVAWSFWVSNWVALASLAIAVGSTLSFIGPPFGGPSSVVPVAIASVVILTAYNAIGARAVGGLQIVTVAIKVLPLLAVISLLFERGASGGGYQTLAPAPVTLANIAAATAMTFYAFTGFESATAPVCKVRDPERTLPRAIFGGTIFVVVLYMLAGTGIQLLLPAEAIVASPAPFADALVSRWGHDAASLAALAIAISAIGCLNGLILVTGELGYSMALRGDLPPAMARTRGINTPYISQIIASVLCILLVLANSSRSTADLYTFIILLSTAAIVLLYFAGALVAWNMSPSVGARSVVAVALLFLAFGTYGTGLEADLWCLALLAAGLVIRAVMHRLNSRAGSSPLEVAIPGVPPGSSA